MKLLRYEIHNFEKLNHYFFLKTKLSFNLFEAQYKNLFLKLKLHHNSQRSRAVSMHKQN